ncbi:oxygen-independent coproporphyrinogen III oxidase [Taylorella asinigenitalis]|uniref:Coproporphyrinogen-III oxidase n=1 Tax=Taylorella asinigenitalis (strain MCE3) TaxID=1008459 RepID=G4QCY9_TAYAM|nr:oxygen-independent coproporphyrinogen III oxidase [Taylorella asinigenitalis]AEP35806.1 Coproporphyrinogen III oxidase, oxygen-independent [Taylorella asinigenitalis MCE3]
MQNLIQKYNIPGPRYTSYPTVPYWDDSTFSPEAYLESLSRSFKESNTKEGISIYIHLPFCEQLCTFCACHKRITKKHSVEEPYIEAVLKEWKLYLDLFKDVVNVKEIHLGGGTPTFFKPENLRKLIEGLFADGQAKVAPNHSFSFEGHPNNTTEDHLKTLYYLGFRRASFGVQDYDPIVQKAINRKQLFSDVEHITNAARDIGFDSISHDLVFGLPFQNWERMEYTIRKTIELKPDRLAFYSYAHVPWIKGVGQRGFDEGDLPSGEEKRKLYENGKLLLQELGYVEVGMDHFSLPTDELYQSMLNKKIHRNFMGYTSSSTQVMVGLGASSIGDSWYGFVQNIKEVEAYYEGLAKGGFPFLRGHILSDEDLIIRRHILNIMCLLETSWEQESMQFPELPQVLVRLEEMQSDGLLEIYPNGLKVTDAGRTYVRNICMAFDLRMLRNQPETRIFSMTV